MKDDEGVALEMADRKAATRPARRRRDEAVNTIQDLYLNEYLEAVRLAEQFESSAEFQAALASQLPQNSAGTRRLYASRITTLLFPSGEWSSPALGIWRAYRDDALLRDAFRVRYLEAIAPVRAFLLDVLSGVEVGEPLAGDRVLRFMSGLGIRAESKTAERLPRNLSKLGFLSRSSGGYRRAVPPYDPTSVVLELCRRFGNQPTTVPFAEIVQDPFWRFIGVPDAGALRTILYRAFEHGGIAKFVKADELDQVTLARPFAELLEARWRLP
jgi:hypothetical protein